MINENRCIFYKWDSFNELITHLHVHWWQLCLSIVFNAHSSHNEMNREWETEYQQTAMCLHAHEIIGYALIRQMLTGCVGGCAITNSHCHCLFWQRYWFSGTEQKFMNQSHEKWFTFDLIFIAFLSFHSMNWCVSKVESFFKYRLYVARDSNQMWFKEAQTKPAHGSVYFVH